MKVTRAVFYCARLLSAQLDKEFTNKSDDKVKYDGIKKVYSIWICMNPYQNARDFIAEYHIQPNILYGSPTKAFRYDLLSAVMINMGKKGTKSENKLIDMLATLLSEELGKENKKRKLEDEFALPMTTEFEQEVDTMCNLSDYVEEKGREEGRSEANLASARKMLLKNMQISLIMDITDLSKEKVERLKKEMIEEGQLKQ